MAAVGAAPGRPRTPLTGRIEALAGKVLEAELASRRSGDRNLQPLRSRLKKLLSPEKNDAYSAMPNQPVSDFATVLSQYAKPDNKGRYSLQFFMSGGSRQPSERLGTFNVQGALRADREQQCPLCEDDLNISNHVRQSDWMVIPEAQDRFGGAFLVFYFDLGRNLIPSRYERHLPMPVADIVEQLEQGKSFTVAKERPGSPPVVLIAAPRSAMLDEVERHLANLTSLPLEPAFVPVSQALRPFEIRSVVRSQMRAPLRWCYEALLTRTPDVSGKMVLQMVVDADGKPNGVSVSSESADLNDNTFQACAKKAGGALMFPETAGETTVKYPFALNAD